MSETAPAPSRSPIDAWVTERLLIPDVVPEAERKFWTTEEINELRNIGGPIVRAAYILDGVRPDWYGGRLAQSGACKGTAAAVRDAAHRHGYHAQYVESLSGGHGLVHLPTSEEELKQLPDDPMIADPTYAQFMNPRMPDRATGLMPDPIEIMRNEQKIKIGIGRAKGHHTEEHPYFIGRASVLNDPASGRDTAFLMSPWQNLRVQDGPHSQ